MIDRVYISARVAARPRVRVIYDESGLEPGFENNFNFGLLARPMSDEAFAATTVYMLADGNRGHERGTLARVDGEWHLTDAGRSAALAVQRAVGEAAERLWSARPIATMPGLGALPRLNALVGRLLEAGAATGGPAFAAMAPPFEPPEGSEALRLISRLGALRHHRGDAHRAAWTAEGLTVEKLRELADGPLRQRIEDETDRRDAPIYEALSESERLELLAGLGTLPDGLRD
ncbi:hypothetical protein [Glycomyces tarimensis]